MLEILCEANTQDAFLNLNAPPALFALARDLLDFRLFGGMNYLGGWIRCDPGCTVLPTGRFCGATAGFSVTYRTVTSSAM